MIRFAISYVLILTLLLAGQVMSLARGGGMTDVVMVLCGGDGLGVPLPGDDTRDRPCADCVMVTGAAVLPELASLRGPEPGREAPLGLRVTQGARDLRLSPVARGPPAIA
ncbi:hypothetical protein ACM25N_06555 [Roseovarius sp. C7]|uniref:hypothetical protein n=1 Tax=Roseovarius sp. C7 TaxID=3398643 RepID=UPI0039F6CB0E